jgi:hypothetical protein
LLSRRPPRAHPPFADGILAEPFSVFFTVIARFSSRLRPKAEGRANPARRFFAVRLSTDPPTTRRGGWVLTHHLATGRTMMGQDPSYGAGRAPLLDNTPQ